MSAGCINQTNGTPAAIRTLMAGLEDRCTIPCATGALWSLVGGLNSVSAGYEPARYADSRAIVVRGGSRTRKTCILSAVPVPNSVTRTSRNGLPGGDRTRITRILSAVRMPFPAPGEYGVPTRIRTGNQTLLRRLRMPFRHRDKWSSVQEVPFLHTAPQTILKGTCSFGLICDGTHGRTRTSNLPVNGRLLYRLSYTGVIKLSCQVARRIKRIVRFCRAILNISLGLFVPKQSQINIVTAQWVHCSSPNTDSCQVWISRQKNAVNRTLSFGAH